MYQDAKDNFEAVLKRLPDHSSAFNRLVCTFMITATSDQADLLRTCFLDLLYVPGAAETEDDADEGAHLGDDGLQVRAHPAVPTIQCPPGRRRPPGTRPACSASGIVPTLRVWLLVSTRDTRRSTSPILRRERLPRR